MTLGGLSAASATEPLKLSVARSIYSLCAVAADTADVSVASTSGALTVNMKAETPDAAVAQSIDLCISAASGASSGRRRSLLQGITSVLVANGVPTTGVSVTAPVMAVAAVFRIVPPGGISLENLARSLSDPGVLRNTESNLVAGTPPIAVSVRGRKRLCRDD